MTRQLPQTGIVKPQLLITSPAPQRRAATAASRSHKILRRARASVWDHTLLQLLRRTAAGTAVRIRLCSRWLITHHQASVVPTPTQLQPTAVARLGFPMCLLAFLLPII